MVDTVNDVRDFSIDYYRRMLHVSKEMVSDDQMREAILLAARSRGIHSNRSMGEYQRLMNVRLSAGARFNDVANAINNITGKNIVATDNIINNIRTRNQIPNRVSNDDLRKVWSEHVKQKSVLDGLGEGARILAEDSIQNLLNLELQKLSGRVSPSDYSAFKSNFLSYIDIARANPSMSYSDIMLNEAPNNPNKLSMDQIYKMHSYESKVARGQSLDERPSQKLLTGVSNESNNNDINLITKKELRDNELNTIKNNLDNKIKVRNTLLSKNPEELSKQIISETRYKLPNKDELYPYGSSDSPGFRKSINIPESEFNSRLKSGTSKIISKHIDDKGIERFVVMSQNSPLGNVNFTAIKKEPNSKELRAIADIKIHPKTGHVEFLRGSYEGAKEKAVDRLIFETMLTGAPANSNHLLNSGRNYARNFLERYGIDKGVAGLSYGINKIKNSGTLNKLWSAGATAIPYIGPAMTALSFALAPDKGEAATDIVIDTVTGAIGGIEPLGGPEEKQFEQEKMRMLDERKKESALQETAKLDAKIHAMDPLVTLSKKLAPKETPPQIEFTKNPKGGIKGTITASSLYKVFLYIQKKSARDAGLEYVLPSEEMVKAGASREEIKAQREKEARIFLIEQRKAKREQELYAPPVMSPQERIFQFKESLKGKSEEELA